MQAIRQTLEVWGSGRKTLHSPLSRALENTNMGLIDRLRINYYYYLLLFLPHCLKKYPMIDMIGRRTAEGSV